MLAILAIVLLAMGASPAAAAGGHHDPATITVSSTDCVQVAVTSSKSISNVVLEFTDGDTQRFEGLPESRDGTFAGTGDNNGEAITAAWIKSGNNKSGDGPGYGEGFEFEGCEVEDGDEGDEDEDQNGDNGEGTDDDGDNGTDGDGDPTDVPPTPQDINDPVDELPVGQTATGDDFDDAVLNAVDEPDASDQDPQVLGVQESNDVVTAAAATDELPAAGAGAWTTLLAALVSIALGGVLLRRPSSTRRTPA